MGQALEGLYRVAICATKEFGLEREWQKKVLGCSFSERDLLREAAWVILCSGFSERVVRGRFDAISLCFCDWVSAEYIMRRAERCRSTAMAVFGSARKIGAIEDVCRYVCEHGFDTLSSCIQADPVRELRKLPFIGPVTSYHLAKNLGIDVVKPDRHLARLASKFGFGSAESMCTEIGHQVGEPASVVDIVLWRYCALSHAASIRTAVDEDLVVSPL
jgi:hypothetical protein